MDLSFCSGLVGSILLGRRRITPFPKVPWNWDLLSFDLFRNFQVFQVYAVASEDMDSLTFGAPKFLRHLMDPSSRKIPVMEFEVSKVLRTVYTRQIYWYIHPLFLQWFCFRFWRNWTLAWINSLTCASFLDVIIVTAFEVLRIFNDSCSQWWVILIKHIWVELISCNQLEILIKHSLITAWKSILQELEGRLPWSSSVSMDL